MDDMRNTQASLYGKAEPATAKTTMSVREMQHLLGLGKTDSYWLLHKNFFEVILINDKMRIVISSFEKWYANQIKYHKVTGEEPGKELKSCPIPLRKSQICWGLMIILFMNYSRKIKWKLLLSITGNEYQKNLFRTGIKASPGIEQRKTEKKTLFWKMQQLRCLRWHSCLEQPEAQYIQFLIIQSIVIFLNSL